MKFLVKTLTATALLAGIGQTAYAHGFIEQPASRNYNCGVITTPDNKGAAGTFAVCQEAFINTPATPNNSGPYDYMGIFSHSKGAGEFLEDHARSPTQNVCGFDSEHFGGTSTIWDQPIDWPTSDISPGLNKFIWNIQRGPHREDTDEFKFWITKDNYQFEVGKRLKWSDFDAKPFCKIKWHDATRSGTPDTVSYDEDTQKFTMECNVPEKIGHQVIYAEWGRNPNTYERFHSCMDVNFIRIDPNRPIAKVTLESGTHNEVNGRGRIVLDARASNGKGLTYLWSIAPSANADLYKLNNDTKARATLILANNNQVKSTVTVNLKITNKKGETSNDAITITHFPSGALMNYGPLFMAAPQNLQPGYKVTLRGVTKDGKDIYYPDAQGITITNNNTAANIWAKDLAQSVNTMPNSDIMLGVKKGNRVNAAEIATDNSVFVKSGSEIRETYVQITPGQPANDANNGNNNGGGNGTNPGQTVDTAECKLTQEPGANPWAKVLKVGIDKPSIDLDFSGTGINLNDIITDTSHFVVTINGSTMHLTKASGQDWINKAYSAGTIVIKPKNPSSPTGYAPLAGETLPICK